MHAACIRVLALALALLASPAFALDPPDHERWQASMSAARAAVDGRNITALGPAIEGVFEQAIRMRDLDPRTPPSGAVIVEALQLLEVASRTEFVAVLERLDDLTKVPGGLSSSLSTTPAMNLANVLAQDGRYAEARELLHAVAERATADLGSAHGTVRIARQQEAGVAMAMGDFEGALVILNEALDSARRTFGSESSEYADVLISMALAHERRNDVRAALALGDEALAIVTGPARQSTQVNVILQLAELYDECGEFRKARELYQRVEVSVANVRDDEPDRVRILGRLAYLNARLGDGAAARVFMTRASEIGGSVAQRFPAVYIEALLNEAAIYNMAGAYDEAVASVERTESLGASFGPQQTAALDQRKARAYLGAERWERALALGEGLLQAALPETADYAAAAAIVAIASALRDQPVARTALAQKAVDIRRALDPSSEPFYELLALAVSYAADGRIQESAELQKRITDTVIGVRGPYVIGWQQQRTYAATLEKLGRSVEAAEILSRVAAESAPLSAALGPSQTVPPGVFVSEQSPFGFSVELGDVRWRRWSGESTGWPMAAFAAQFHTGPGQREATLVVMPVLLPEGLDRDAALAGLLEHLEHDRAVLQPWSSANQSGYQYRFSQTPLPGRPFDYTGRAVFTEGGFYLAIAAVFANSETAAEAAAQALDRVVVGRRPDPRTLAEDERKLHGNILNNIGVGMAGRALFREALIALEAAREFNLNDTLLQNVIFVNLQAGNFSVVVDEVGRYPGGPAAYPKLYLVRAVSEAGLGNTAEALADFRAGFATGLRDDDTAAEFVGLLLAEGQAEAGAEFLDEYAAEQSSPDILALQALLGVQMEDDVRLQNALNALEDPARSSADAALVAAVIHREAGGVGAVTAFVERLPAALLSAELYALLGATQMQAELFDAARRTVARGLELAPSNADLNALAEALRGAPSDEVAL